MGQERGRSKPALLSSLLPLRQVRKNCNVANNRIPQQVHASHPPVPPISCSNSVQCAVMTAQFPQSRSGGWMDGCQRVDDGGTAPDTVAGGASRGLRKGMKLLLFIPDPFPFFPFPCHTAMTTPLKNKNKYKLGEVGGTHTKHTQLRSTE